MILKRFVISGDLKKFGKEKETNGNYFNKSVKILN